jgi:hypothetical protein
VASCRAATEGGRKLPAKLSAAGGRRGRSLAEGGGGGPGFCRREAYVELRGSGSVGLPGGTPWYFAWPGFAAMSTKGNCWSLSWGKGGIGPANDRRGLTAAAGRVA